MENNAISNFITQAFDIYRFRNFVSEVFANSQDGLEFCNATFTKLGHNHIQIQEECALLPQAIILQDVNITPHLKSLLSKSHQSMPK
ncbi:hypothetical protein BBW65_06075 [Helicobacter enhydrae]|uniref:Uncharacterized protein n=1 Tax=Helicobacter enhydrae TaxID=222136 RepID=A0A1B1U6G2_9HELI|nr:hypothetical protein [Helicobacter enhydrae]ANV98387.1 hypothetical protein BBW65_06075 [Helicobacter enhydrae]